MSIGTQDSKLRLGLTSSASRRDAQRERELHELRVELRATPIACRRPATFRRRGLWTIEDEKDIHACGLTLDKPEHERLEREIGPAKAISSACDLSKVKKRTSHPGADQRSSRGPAVDAQVSAGSSGARLLFARTTTRSVASTPSLKRLLCFTKNEWPKSSSEWTLRCGLIVFQRPATVCGQA